MRKINLMNPLNKWFRPAPCCMLVVGLAVLLAGPAFAGDPANPWYITVYGQQSFPKQTNTNNQIKLINDTFGVNFKTWDDVANLNIGVHVYKKVAPMWKLGVEFDYSQGGIDGSATVQTEAGPALLSFEQKYSTYADVLAVAQFLPCRSCVRATPFLFGGLGYAYEKDRTTLTLKNDFIDQYLRVDNDGWLPVVTVGVGFDAEWCSRTNPTCPPSLRGWYVEMGGAYAWSRLKHDVNAYGPLAPGPKVTADTDSTGPNYWVGIGRRF